MELTACAGWGLPCRRAFISCCTSPLNSSAILIPLLSHPLRIERPKRWRTPQHWVSAHKCRGARGHALRYCSDRETLLVSDTLGDATTLSGDSPESHPPESIATGQACAAKSGLGRTIEQRLRTPELLRVPFGAALHGSPPQSTKPVVVFFTKRHSPLLTAHNLSQVQAESWLRS